MSAWPPRTAPAAAAASGTPDAAPTRWRWQRLVRRTAIAVTTLVVVAMVGIWFSPIGGRYRADAANAAPVTGVSTIAISDSNFEPAAVAVATGATLTWTWTDGQAHDVVFSRGSSAGVQETGSWTRTFDEPGEYLYSCTLHAFMDGRVVVTPG